MSVCLPVCLIFPPASVSVLSLSLSTSLSIYLSRPNSSSGVRLGSTRQAGRGHLHRLRAGLRRDRVRVDSLDRGDRVAGSRACAGPLRSALGLQVFRGAITSRSPSGNRVQYKWYRPARKETASFEDSGSRENRLPRQRQHGEACRFGLRLSKSPTSCVLPPVIVVVYCGPSQSSTHGASRDGHSSSKLQPRYSFWGARTLGIPKAASSGRQFQHVELRPYPPR